MDIKTKYVRLCVFMCNYTKPRCSITISLTDVTSSPIMQSTARICELGVWKLSFRGAERNRHDNFKCKDRRTDKVMEVNDSVPGPILSNGAVFTVTNLARRGSHARGFLLALSLSWALSLEKLTTPIFKKWGSCVLFDTWKSNTFKIKSKQITSQLNFTKYSFSSKFRNYRVIIRLNFKTH